MMTMSTVLDDLWDSLKPGNEEVFKLVDASHPLKIYAGLNQANQRILLLISSCNLPKFPISQSIEVTTAKRHDGRWAMRMTLTNRDLGQLFSMLCSDLLVATNQSNTEVNLVLIFHNRYIKWMKLLERTGSGLLDKNSLRGLIGELSLLKTLIAKFESDDAVGAWVGPLAVHQDFHFSQTWFEVKTIHPGADHVKISSVEQLDVQGYLGVLVVVEVDTATGYEPRSFCLTQLITEVRQEIQSPSARLNFEDKLLEIGYTDRQEYEELFFTVGKPRYFEVKQDFPCLRRAEMPNGIRNATYDLSINFLQPFESTESEVFSHGASGLSQGTH